jgi:predicted nucleotide-binding protein (sugar kinase/HSP70/actin superfamily)
MCGREESSRSVIQKGASRFMLARTLAGLHERNDRKGTKSQNSGQPLSIGISPVLAMYQYMRFWRCFWETLGCRVVMNNETDDSIRDEALRVSRSDFCYPVKIALGHASIVSKREDIDALFIPAHISDRLQKNGLPRVFCPYVISYASVVSSLNLGKPVLSPTIDFRRNERFNTEGLFRMLEHYGYSMTEIRRAYRSAMKAHLSFQRDRFIRGKEIVDSVSESGKPAIVFFGRPYNLYDNRINLNLPERFRSFGFEVLPYDFFIDPDDTAQVHHMYWNFGEAILKIARTIRDIENIYPVYFTNFTCGPDSFILSRFEKIMAGKPYLIIELDEHGAETGFVTRIEAFADIVNEQKSRQFLKTPFRENFEAKWRSRERKLWIPAMHEITARLFAAGFRAWGYESEDLPVETKADFEFGKSRVRGGECLPAITTIGTFIRRLRETGAKPEEHALFMPTAEGPCRFGQYSVLHRSILDSEGFHDTAIFAPSSVNSYMGMPNSMRLYLWEAMLAGDMIMKAICRTRPYEMNAGETDEVAAHYIEEIESVIENRGNVLDALKNAVSSICSVPVSGEKKPLVGIVGEIYVRCNPFCNSNLIRTVEKCGGESWLSPLSEWVLYTSWFENYYTGKTSRMPLKKLLVSLKTDYFFQKSDFMKRARALAWGQARAAY